MPKEFASPNSPSRALAMGRSRPGIRPWSFIGHWALGIGHSTARLLFPVALLIASGPTHAAPSNDAPGRLLDLEFQLPTSREKNSDRTIHLRGKDARQQLLVT